MQNSLRKKKVAIAAGIFVALLACSIVAVASSRTSMNNLRVILLAAVATGWDFREQANSGYLEEGDYRVISTTLYSGTRYKILAAGDETVRDLDILLYDENKRLIDQDQGTDAVPIVEVTPRWTGTFYVAVRMHRGYGYSSVAVCYK